MCLNDDLFHSHILLHSPLLVEILCIALVVVLLSLLQQALDVFWLSPNRGRYQSMHLCKCQHLAGILPICCWSIHGLFGCASSRLVMTLLYCECSCTEILCYPSRDCVLYRTLAVFDHCCFLYQYHVVPLSYASCYPFQILRFNLLLLFLHIFFRSSWCLMIFY